MHLHRALHLDLEDNIIAGLQLFVHRSLQRAVVVINVLRVLEERIGGDLRFKVLFREEIILYAVLFARTRRTGRRRDREEQLLVLAQQPDSTVPLPAPDGPVNTYNVPLRIFWFSFLGLARKTSRNGLRLQSTEHHMVAVHDEYSTGASAVGAVHDHAAVAGLLHGALDRWIPG